MEASKAFQLHANHETLWEYLSSSSTRSEGVCVWKYEHVRWTQCRFSRRATLAAQKGGRQYTEQSTSGAASLARPKGCFTVRYVWS